MGSSALAGTSYLFTLPLIAAGLAALKSDETSKRAAGIAHWSATIVALLVIAPVAYTTAVVEAGMGAAGAAVLGLLVSLSAWLLAPHLEAVRAPRPWATAVIASACAFVVLASSILFARRSATYPIPSMLAYALDADSTDAWLLAPARLARVRSWSATALGDSRLIRPRGSVSAGAVPSWLTRAIAGEAPTRVASTRRVDVGAPNVVVVSDSTRNGERRLRLHVQPSPSTYSVRLRAPGARIDSVAVDGRIIAAASNRTPASIWSLGYVAPPAQGFEVSLFVRGNEPFELDVVARSLGLPPAVLTAVPPRPRGVVAVHAGDQTVVHRVFRI